MNLKNTAEWIGTLILHFLVAMFAGSFFGYLLGALSASLILLFTGFRVASLGPITVYTPLVWGWALLLGFVVNRKIRTQSACWVGALAIFCLVVIAWRDISFLKNPSSPYHVRVQGHYLSYELKQLFPTDENDCGSSECLQLLIFTSPLLLSIAYSIGAWLALQNGTRHGEAEQTVAGSVDMPPTSTQ